MDGQEYLNQISAQNRPVKASGGANSILSSKIFIVSMIGILLLVVIVIVGVLLGGGKGGDKQLSIALKLHLDNTSEIIQTYQPDVKSSDLRSSSASLYGILSNTDRDLTAYITEKYGFKEKEVDKTALNDAQLARDGLENDLFQAKIGGTLDRMYALKMAYEISSIQSEEVKIINSTKDTDLVDMLTNSYNSLENLSNKFSGFSEAK